jgi:hypothetical protein
VTLKKTGTRILWIRSLVVVVATAFSYAVVANTEFALGDPQAPVTVRIADVRLLCALSSGGRATHQVALHQLRAGSLYLPRLSNQRRSNPRCGRRALCRI